MTRTYPLLFFFIHSALVAFSASAGENKIDVAKLFGRQERDYPTLDVHGPAPRPVWVEAFKALKDAGRVPSIQPSTKTESGTVQYANGITEKNTEVCSWTLGCRNSSDITDAPANMMGVSFDDGPSDGTSTLLKFLTSSNQKATHFLIGSQIKKNADNFMNIINSGHDAACHTWSHPLMSTMTDEQALGEIGWTLQIIYDMTNKVPTLFRPPYGDVDNRIRAIAKLVFGLDIVMWNHDTNDWCLNEKEVPDVCKSEGPKDEEALVSQLKGLAKGPKSPGLIILEHELTDRTVNGFVKAYPEFKSNGWDMRTISGLFNKQWYNGASGSGGSSDTKGSANATNTPPTTTNPSGTNASPNKNGSPTSGASGASSGGSSTTTKTTADQQNAAQPPANATGHKNGQSDAPGSTQAPASEASLPNTSNSVLLGLFTAGALISLVL